MCTIYKMSVWLEHYENWGVPRLFAWVLMPKKMRKRYYYMCHGEGRL